ncbi:general substrate transporter [Leptodontidium sp. MPI-SDFR-AT-0119]|nr:general substrate transporter [Leptodontidium sp. MPI-SDFR-AT-0119]
MEKDSKLPANVTGSGTWTEGEVVTPAPRLARFFPGPSPNRNPQHTSARTLSIGVNICAGAVLMLSGWNVALFGSVSTNANYLSVVGLSKNTPHNQLLIGLINSIYFLGVIAGALLCGPLSDKVGRRKSLVTGGLLGFIAIPMLTATKNFVWTICCRFLNGIATGGMDAAALTWTAEIASQHHRGRMVGILMCLAATGASTVYFMMYGLSAHSTGGLVWRLPVAFQLVFITVMIPAVFVLPESPRWMVKVGMIADARIVLRSLHASGDSSDAAVENDLQAIIDAHAEAARDLSSTSYWRMLLVPDEYATVRRTWSALFVQFSTQALIGASFVGGYGISIFVTGGWSTHLASLLVGVSIVTQAVSGLCGVMWSEKMGRRYAMVGGALMGCALLALIGMCGYFVNKHSIGNPGLAKQYGGVTVALLLLWCAQFGATWLWCPFTYPSEIFPLRYRARGSSFGIVGFGMGSFLANMVSTYLFEALGYKTMFLLSGCSLFVGVVCFFAMPETAGKSLEEIENTFLTAGVKAQHS